MNGFPVARSHPPSLLEWKAAKERANMAVECHFPDGMMMIDTGPILGTIGIFAI